MRFKARSHLGTAWTLLKRHWQAFFLAQLTVVATWVALELAVVATDWVDLPVVAHWSLWLCLHAAYFWVFCGLMAGIHRMALQAVDGATPTFVTALSRLDRGSVHLLASFLYWAAVL